MKVGMVLGIMGGVIALLIGSLGYGLTSTVSYLATSTDNPSGAEEMEFYSIAAIALPIVALVGAGLALRNPLISAVLMAASALGMLAIFGIGMISLVPTILLGVASLLIFLNLQNRSQPEKGK